MRRSSPAITLARALALLTFVAALLAPRAAAAVTRPDAVARAQSWVDAGMPYCQCPNHAYDKNGLCTRPDNADWDPYRSDCSGLVSYAWELAPPGMVTWTLWNVSTIIDAADLKPGDALDSDDHVMLFAGWTVYPTVANLIDEHIWGTDARRADFNVTINGSTITRSDWPSNPFTAIRYNGIQDTCQPSCSGNIITGPDCGSGDCGLFGATCVDDAIGVRCVSVFCAPTGSSTLCIPGSQILATCTDGALSGGDCGAYGAICDEKGGAHCVAPYAATVVAQGSKQPEDSASPGVYRACAGEAVETSFEIRNDGYLPWSDESDADPMHYGKAIRLGVMRQNGDADPFTTETRVSIAKNGNADVHYDGGDCDDKAGCSRTLFHVAGVAPTAPGSYITSWQLVDETRAWFGPIMSLPYEVATCSHETPQTSPTPEGNDGSPAVPSASDDASDDGSMHGIACAVSATPSGSSFGALAITLVFAFALLRKRGLAAAIAALFAAGCGQAPESNERLATTQEALQVCPGGATVPGIDVSSWQGAIDWNAVGGSGLAFAIVRIGDGLYADPDFGFNWSQSKAVGLIRGAYLFYEPNDDAATQANIVVNAVGQLGPGDLPVTLDVEWTNGTPNAQAIQTWVDIVTQGTGKRPMIYTALGYWNQYFNGEFADIDLWVANWDISCPNLPDSWANWLFWQPGGGGTPGIAGNVDQDVFNGSLTDLQLLAGANLTQNCAGSEGGACAHFGCACVDDQCNGGFCPGSGCTAQHTNDCAQFGCQCVDGECSGGFCPGQGCTAKESTDCSNVGCGCVDHACAGGACAGTGCTAKETNDCAQFGLACANNMCVQGTSSSSSDAASSSAAAGGETTTGAGPGAGGGAVASSAVGTTGPTTGSGLVGSGGGVGGNGAGGAPPDGDSDMTGGCQSSSHPVEGGEAWALLGLALIAGGALRGRGKHRNPSAQDAARLSSSRARDGSSSSAMLPPWRAGDPSHPRRR